MDLLSPIIGTNVYLDFRTFFQLFTFFEYGLWFLIGMVLKNLYDNKIKTPLLIYFITLFFFQTLLIANIYTVTFSILTFSVLILFIYKPQFVSFLGTKTMSKIGIASYSIYLLHENVGVLIINKLSSYFGGSNWIVPILVVVLMCIFGVISYKYLETPFGKSLKDFLFKRKI